MSKTGQRRDAKFFKTFARASCVQSDQREKLSFARLFSWFLRVNAPFMLATLELNTCYNHLYGSTLERTISCIDELSRESKIELPDRIMLYLHGHWIQYIVVTAWLAARFFGFWDDDAQNLVPLPQISRSVSVCTNVH